MRVTIIVIALIAGSLGAIAAVLTYAVCNATAIWRADAVLTYAVCNATAIWRADAVLTYAAYNATAIWRADVVLITGYIAHICFP